MKKRLLTLIMTVALAATALTACGGKKTSDIEDVVNGIVGSSSGTNSTGTNSTGTNSDSNASVEPNAPKLCARSAEWDTIDTSTTAAIQIEDVLYYVGMSGDEFLNHVLASSMNYTVDATASDIVDTGARKKITVSKNGKELLSVEVWNISEEACELGKLPVFWIYLDTVFGNGKDEQIDCFRIVNGDVTLQSVKNMTVDEMTALFNTDYWQANDNYDYYTYFLPADIHGYEWTGLCGAISVYLMAYYDSTSGKIERISWRTERAAVSATTHD